MRKLIVVCLLFATTLLQAQYSDQVIKNLELKAGLKIGGKTVTAIATDTTLSGNSDATLPTQKAVKKYADAAINAAKIYANVKDFGAIGDGTTDNKIAFQNAANFCRLNSRVLFIPNGIYLVSDSIVINEISIKGEDMSRTIVKSGIGKDIFCIAKCTGSQTSKSITDITFLLNTTSVTRSRTDRRIYPIIGNWSSGISVVYNQYYKNGNDW